MPDVIFPLDSSKNFEDQKLLGHNRWHPEIPLVATVKPGDSFRVDCREWFDGAGNFMGSTVVRLAAGDPPPASFALAAGLAAYEAVVPLLATPDQLSLKWPNDLTLGGAKLAGILLDLLGDRLLLELFCFVGSGTHDVLGWA